MYRVHIPEQPEIGPRLSATASRFAEYSYRSHPDYHKINSERKTR